MKIIKKSTRLQVILQAVILFGFALYFTGAVVSGSAYRYVHERHAPMLLLSAAVFFIIGVLKLKRAMQASQPRKRPYRTRVYTRCVHLLQNGQKQHTHY